MQQLRAVKYKLLPDEKQTQEIKRFCGCTRLVYNTLLNEAKQQLDNKESLVTSKITDLYEEHPFLKGVDSLALANTRLQFQRAFNDFFKSKNGKRNGKKVGFPTFKKRGVSKDSYTTNSQSESIIIEGNMIKLPKIGFVKFKQHKPVNGLIRSVTITVNKDNTIDISVLQYVEVNVKRKQIKNINELKVIGLDMSMHDFYADSEGKKPNFPRHYRKSEKRLKRLNKKQSKKQMLPTGEFKYSEKYKKDVEIKWPSKNREKARIRLAKLSRHVANQRKDFCHQESRKLVNQYDVIVLEDINMQTMARLLKLGKSTNDLGFGMFREFLEYKSIETDTLVIRTPKFYASSQLCSECGYQNTELKLSDREWICPQCGTHHDRDHNAGKNEKNYFYNALHTAGTAEFQACGDGISTLRETLMQVLSVKQEGTFVRFATEAPSFREG